MAESGTLMAAAKLIGAKCMDQNRNFMLCKKEDANPAACLAQGEQVTNCVLSL